MNRRHWLIPVCSLIVVGLVGAYRVQAADHTVTPKTKEVKKDDKIDYADEETAAAESLTLGQENAVRVLSKTFVPPTGWSFVPFPPPHGGTFVDIWANPEGFEFERIKDGAGAIQVRGAFATPINAGEYPLRCEGNIEPPKPPSGGAAGMSSSSPPPPKYHWSAKMGSSTVEFINPQNPNIGVANDCDDFMFREDNKTAKVYYRILPDTLNVTEAKLKIKDTAGTVLRTVDLPTTAGDNQLYKWNGKNNDTGTAQFFDKDTFELELAVKVDGVAVSQYGDDLAIADLVYRHRPIYKLASGERSPPIRADFMMNRANLFRWELSIVGTWYPAVKASAPISLANLAAYDSTDYFMAYNDVNDRFNPPPWITAVYHISFHQGNYVFVQYWCFHATSYIPDAFAVLPDPWTIWWHEGDWEMFQFTVKLDTSATTLDEKLKPHSLTASQHYYAQTLKWAATADTGVPADYVNNQDYVERLGMRPIIYIGHLSHAHYFKAGQFRISGTPSDNSGFQYRDGSVSWLGLRDITGTASETDVAGSQLIFLEKDPVINKWKGHWGATVEPGTIIPPYGDGTPGPILRGPGPGGASGLIESNPKAFHNNFLKVTQGNMAIP